MKDEYQMLKAALGYAERGWSVIPLYSSLNGGCSCKRDDCPSPAKHPCIKGGLSNASAEQEQIREWWSRWPFANIGILTGEESGLIVVDIDNKGGKTGSANLATLALDHGGLPVTLTATTGSGEHLLFRYPNVPVKNSASKIADGVDVRAERGYIVAAPSLHANGRRYAWKDSEHPLADIPAWLLSAITGREQDEGDEETEEHNAFTDAPIIHEGERNDTLYRLGCALRGQHGKEREAIVAILLEYNNQKCEPPLEEAEVLAIIESVCKYPIEITARKSAKRIEANPLYWLQFSTRDFYADQNIQVMEDFQIGWWLRLMVSAWMNGGFLPVDVKVLWKLAKAKSEKVFEKWCDPVLAEYEEVVVDGVRKLRNPAMAARFTRTLEIWMEKKDAGGKRKAQRLAALPAQAAADGESSSS